MTVSEPDAGGARRSDRRWRQAGGWKRADAEQLAEVVGEAGQQVLAGRASEAAQAEGGEAPRLLELAEDRLDDGLAAGVASALQRVEIAVADSRRRCSSCGREPTSALTT